MVSAPGLSPGSFGHPGSIPGGGVLQIENLPCRQVHLNEIRKVYSIGSTSVYVVES